MLVVFCLDSQALPILSGQRNYRAPPVGALVDFGYYN